VALNDGTGTLASGWSRVKFHPRITSSNSCALQSRFNLAEISIAKPIGSALENERRRHMDIWTLLTLAIQVIRVLARAGDDTN
jgi:hypothetical protein